MTAIVRTNLLVVNMNHNHVQIHQFLLVNKAVKIICYLSPWSYEYLSNWLWITISEQWSWCIPYNSHYIKMAFVVNQTYQRTRGHIVVLTAIVKTNSLFLWATFLWALFFPLLWNKLKKRIKGLFECHSNCLNQSIYCHIHVDVSWINELTFVLAFAVKQ